MPEITQDKKLEENCSNCGWLEWLDSIMFRPAARCGNSLMQHKRCDNLETSECLFWKPISTTVVDLYIGGGE